MEHNRRPAPLDLLSCPGAEDQPSSHCALRVAEAPHAPRAADAARHLGGAWSSPGAGRLTYVASPASLLRTSFGSLLEQAAAASKNLPNADLGNLAQGSLVNVGAAAPSGDAMDAGPAFEDDFPKLSGAAVRTQGSTIPTSRAMAPSFYNTPSESSDRRGAYVHVAKVVVPRAAAASAAGDLSAGAATRMCARRCRSRSPSPSSSRCTKRRSVVATLQHTVAATAMATSATPTSSAPPTSDASTGSRSSGSVNSGEPLRQVMGAAPPRQRDEDDEDGDEEEVQGGGDMEEEEEVGGAEGVEDDAVEQDAAPAPGVDDLLGLMSGLMKSRVAPYGLHRAPARVACYSRAAAATRL